MMTAKIVLLIAVFCYLPFSKHSCSVSSSDNLTCGEVTS